MKQSGGAQGWARQWVRSSTLRADGTRGRLPLAGRWLRPMRPRSAPVPRSQATRSAEKLTGPGLLPTKGFSSMKLMRQLLSVSMPLMTKAREAMLV